MVTQIHGFIAPKATIRFFVSTNSAKNYDEIAFFTSLNNDKSFPGVVAISHVYSSEPIFLSSFVSLCDAQFLKAGSLGITVLVSTGDTGAAGVYSDSSTPPAVCLPAPTAFYPAVSPYVTAVGSSYIDNINSANKKEYATSIVVDPSSTFRPGYTTGGGFATEGTRNVLGDAYARPSWQRAAGAAFDEFEWNNETMPYENTYFPANRGIPDVSLLGHGYSTVTSGIEDFDTISAASALAAFSGVATIMNAARRANGLPKMGFLNYFLYQCWESRPDYFFTDIKDGENSCIRKYLVGGSAQYPCCPGKGYGALDGW